LSRVARANQRPYRQARYVVEPRLGLSFARNAGIDAAAGELIAFLDDDTVVDPAWLKEHAKALADDSVAATTGKVLPIGKERALNLGEYGFTLDHSDPWWFERANFGGLGSGANMAFRRSTFGSELRFRENLGLGSELEGFEDYYLWFTLLRDGARIAYVPTAAIEHGPELSPDPVSHRQARDHRRVAAYVTMLLLEEPAFRRRTLRYVVDLLRGRRLPWRFEPVPNKVRILADGYLGTISYLRRRFPKRRVPRRPSRS
jgi:glycosyltransferase involved in cell wall biosynthesis